MMRNSQGEFAAAEMGGSSRVFKPTSCRSVSNSTRSAFGITTWLMLGDVGE